MFIDETEGDTFLPAELNSTTQKDLQLMLPAELKQLDDLSRRQFMANVAKCSLGVSLLPAGLNETLAQSRAGGKAKHVIYLYMSGAMSQVDTFDPKPKSDVQGDTGVVSTAIPGVQFSEYLPKLAKRARQLAVVRSLSTSTGAHGPARYLLRTSYSPIATTKHPGLGSWMHKKLGRIHKELPAAVQIGGGVGPGYMGAEFAPVPLGDPSKGLENTKQPPYLKDSAFDKRMSLSTAFDSSFRRRAASNSKVRGYDDLYTEAIGLLRSKDLAAFDIMKEPAATRNAYGASKFGRGALLSRRLVEHGVRYVEVSLGSWDNHYELWNTLPGKAAELDNVAGQLLSDLQQKGLLKDTLVVIGTEFGRKPKINERNGRDHHPAAFSSVLAGGGIKGGQVYGKTDADAFHVEDDQVSVEELNATIATALGIRHDQEIHSPDGRPFTIGNGGKPIAKLI